LNISWDVQSVIGEDFIPFKCGIEYILFDMISLRAGYDISSDIGKNITIGLGVNKKNWFVDMGYTPFGELGNAFEFTIKKNFGKLASVSEKAEIKLFEGNKKTNSVKIPFMIPSFRADCEDEEALLLFTPAAVYLKRRDYVNAAMVSSFLFYNNPHILLYEYSYAYTLYKSGYSAAAKKIFDKLYINNRYLTEQTMAAGLAKFYYFIGDYSKAENILNFSLQKWNNSQLLNFCLEYVKFALLHAE